MPIITAQQLAKTYRVPIREPGWRAAVQAAIRPRYRMIEALAGVSFTIERGEVVGYIGPNGAGKSTTVKVLAGILVPDGGDCTVDGRVPWNERRHHVAGIGVVFGQRTQLWWDLPVAESFELLRAIYRVPAESYHRSLARLVDRLSLGDLLQRPVRQLSLGQRMRCDLAAALLHSPAILFLDEPTIGLDAPSRLAVRRFVADLAREEGVTVLLTTHDMDDIEAVCSRVILISEGRVLSDGSLSDLRALVTTERRLIIDLGSETAVISDPDAVTVSHAGSRHVLSFDPARVAAHTLIARVAARYPVVDLYVENPPIEEVIAQLYEGPPG